MYMYMYMYMYPINQKNFKFTVSMDMFPTQEKKTKK